MKRSVVAVAVFAALATPCSTSCSTGTSQVSKPAVSTSQHSPPPKPPAHVGDTLNLLPIGGAKIAVTLVEIINPATVQGGWEDPGKSYVATKLTIKNTGTSTVVGDANNNVAVIGSDDKSYRADFAGVPGCTNFTYGEFLIAAGDSETGCVVFALPPGVTTVKVRYMPSSGISRDVGEWLIP
jgi:hypothetical protein